MIPKDFYYLNDNKTIDVKIAGNWKHFHFSVYDDIKNKSVFCSNMSRETLKGLADFIYNYLENN
jgi:hypothetical protein